PIQPVAGGYSPIIKDAHLERISYRHDGLLASIWRGFPQRKPQFGIGGSGAALLPCHTSGHAGPQVVVRKVEVNRQVAVLPNGRSTQCGDIRLPPPCIGGSLNSNGLRHGKFAQLGINPEGHASTALSTAPADADEAIYRGP